jgi:hypothetical protein
MRRIALLALVLGSLTPLLASAPAHAQATRTWVSGVGDDANPCSRTAPCKTFAGAISKTATGGEINVLDPGGFGGVTITKSITISSEGFEAGVLVSGTNAIIINATSTSNVVLRGLDIEGLGTGLVGIKVLGALGALHVENCTINNFRGTNGSGMEIATSVAGTTKVFVQDTIVRNNGIFPPTSTGQGILLNSTVATSATLDHVRLDHNVAGLKIQGPGNVHVSDSIAANNAFAGYSAFNTGANLTIERSVATHNAASGAAAVVCNSGATVRLGNVSFSDNNNTTISTGGNCITFKNNDADIALPALTMMLPQ